MAIHLLARPREARVPHLQILERERLVLSYQLRSPRTVIGRSDAADIALPSDAVSRTHCVVERRDSGWWVVDHSRHGTRLGGRAVDESPLLPGDTLELGEYRVRLVEQPVVPEVSGTVTRLVRPGDHEEILDLGDTCATRQVELRAVDGPARGATWRCQRSRTRIGGRGAHIVLSADLPPDAVFVRVVRGRAMVEPGSRPAFLAGQRVRELTPALDGETLKVGEHEVELRAIVVHDGDPDLACFGDLVGSSSAMRHVFGMLERVARHDATALLLGESGTGKELAARGIHEASPRHDRSFVAINCAAIPENLVESELFGHEPGAFTGATNRRDGAFQRADGGTLFLDEIGEMSPEVQAKLLRALESGEVRRVGGAAPEFPDVRIVAATHRDLGRRVDDGTFRRDLLYRLAVLTIPIPPLRARREDIPELARVLLARSHPGAILTADAARALQGYDWPGNVRELRNVLTRAVVLDGPRIQASALSFQPWTFEDAPEPAWRSPDASERERIRETLLRCGGNRAHAARELGLARTSLLYKLRRYGLE